MTTQNLTYRDAIERVLSEADRPLQPAQIARRIRQNNYRREALEKSVAAVLSGMVKEGTAERPRTKHYQLPSQSTVQIINGEILNPDEEEQLISVSAYGLYWERDKVNWDPTNGKLLGSPDDSDEEIDFADQWGIYILHNSLTVMYVGRTSSDNTGLYQRLRDHHTRGRRTARWDEFSWFGFRRVNADGSLSQHSASFTTAMLIRVLESVMIEALIPPLNNRGGELMGTMYRQVEDPEIKRRREQEIRHIVSAG